MKKLVVLKLYGEFDRGFQVTLEVGSEGSSPETVISGELPSATELVENYSNWQSTYRSLGVASRYITAKQTGVNDSLETQKEDCCNLPWELLSPLNWWSGLEITFRELIAKTVRVNVSFKDQKKECRQSADDLCSSLYQWLNSDVFLPIEKKLLEKLNESDEVRVMIRTKSRELQKLPWHRWDLLERYPKAEIALSPPEWESITKVKTPINQNQVRILAILGNSAGIDVDKDRQVLENLPNAATTFLVEPSQEQLNDQLWEQPWDILFFAGHSETQNQTGRIYINQTDSISIGELKYGLKKAIAQGLQLAIFNSCDGLGLASELEQLNIPQMIVMREPVPDLVAQKFLKYFLRAFADGKSFYMAQREARERLQGIEDQFPCASWLPVICQNPTVVPPSWSSLQGRTGEQGRGRDAGTRGRGDAEKRELKRRREDSAALSNIAQVFRVSIAVTLLVMGVRYTGVLEPWELEAYDRLIRQRPPELIDDRILVVEVTEEDLEGYQYPLDDEMVAQLLNKLASYKPRVLGLDMHRYQPRGENREDLISSFADNQNFFTVCAANSTDSNYASPPEFLEKQLINQLGFSDLIVDSWQLKNRNMRSDLAVTQQPENKSRTVRRQLLSYDSKLSRSPSACATSYSLSFQLAYRFLYEQGIQPLAVNSNEEWEFGSVAFNKSARRFGGYQSLDGLSSQVMINYRSSQPAQKVTLKQVLSGQVDSKLVKDRVVLIGYTAPVARDYFDTPYGKMPGVWIHAHMVSQMLSAVIDERPLLWVLPQWGGLQWGDAIWVLAWSITSGLLVWALRSRSLLYVTLATGTATFILYQICLFLLTQGGWVPLIPSALAIVSTGTILVTIEKQFEIVEKCDRFGTSM
ncbi:MAG: CHASE2 domain-containing protein [Symploca sp. SIO1C2]|nr:CHASE2 domain-containing protein [Symploca sp. SIO1C2]